MRKGIYLAISVIMLSLPTSAQWTTSGNNLSNSNTGNVGIGTSSPLDKLDVNGHISLSGGAKEIHFRGSDGLVKQYLWLNSANSLGMGAGSDLSSMYISTNGHVGIGTSNPSSKLDVLGTANFATPTGGYTLSVGGSGGDYGSVGYNQQYGNNSNAYTYKVADYASFLKFNLGGFDFYTAPSGTAGSAISYTNVMRIDQAGKIGIGTTTPAERLHVIGNLVTSNSTGGVFRVVASNINSGAYNLQSYSNPLFVNELGNNTLINTNSGVVGIGTSAPDIAYKLSVNGSIRSKEIKVETGWADYVFDEAYKLRPITEVEAYIRQNHHLPDVPSAAEVEKNGVNLGETSALLLKKIEELTLYLIEKDKQITEQNNRLEQQQKINNSLQEQLDKLAKKIN